MNTSLRSGPVTRRVQRIARWTRALTVVGAVTLPICALSLWTTPEWIRKFIVRDLFLNQDQIVITPAVQWAGATVSLLPLAVALYGLWQVWQLFGEYARGAIFSATASMRLRRMAWALIGVTAAQIAERTLSGIVLTIHNPPGQKMLVVILTSNDYALLLFGVLLLAIAWVMVEATRIAQEHAEFI